MFSRIGFFACMARLRPAGLSRCRQDICYWRKRWHWIVSIALANLCVLANPVVFAKAGSYSYVVPKKVTLLYITLQGGGGGKGGDDDQPTLDDGSSGNVGGSGALIAGYLRVNPGDQLMVYVGSAGKIGASRTTWGNQAAGGTLPDSQNAGSGGKGGRPGKSGYSGGGGGGGAASYMLIQNRNIVPLVTGGGGGGQGGALLSESSLKGRDAGYFEYIEPEQACIRPVADVSDGGDGADFLGDGGGGGGGGGGAVGGKVGSGHADRQRGSQGNAAGAGYTCIDLRNFVRDRDVSTMSDNAGNDGNYSIQIAMPKLRLGVQTIGEIQGFTLTAGQNWNNGKGITLSTSKIRQTRYSQWANLNRYYEALEFSSSAPPDWQIGEARCRDTQATRSGNSAAEIIARPIAAGRWQLDASYIKNGAEIECYITYTYEKFTLAGKLLADRDPASQQYQQPQAGVALSLDDCAGKQIASTVTDQNGLFSFIAQAVPQSAHCIRQHLPAGWLLRSVECRDSRSEFSENVSHGINAPLLPPAVTQDWQLQHSRVRPGARWNCSVSNMYPGFHISGQILNDNGMSGGAAHDGVANGGETGRGGVELLLDDCAGKNYSASIRSVPNGWFSFNAEAASPGPVCVRQRLPHGLQAVSFNGGTADAAYRQDAQGYDELRFELKPKTSYSGLLFGHIGNSLLSGSGQQQIAAGRSVTYAHIYTAATTAKLGFGSADSDAAKSEKMPGWYAALLLDGNCNARQDAAENGIDAASLLDVKAGEQVCILQRVQSPPTALPAQRYVSQIVISETITPQPASGLSPIVREWRADNLTEISNAGESLKLSKQVRQVASCPSTAADSSSFTTSNQALPGSYVEYLISYFNLSDQPLRDLIISDAVPAYTVFRHAACDDLPVHGLSECSWSKIMQSAGQESIEWRLHDATGLQPGEVLGLQPGANGSVRYCVQILRN